MQRFTFIERKEKIHALFANEQVKAGNGIGTGYL